MQNLLQGDILLVDGMRWAWMPWKIAVQLIYDTLAW